MFTKQLAVLQKLADLSTSPNPRMIDGILLTKFDTIDDKVGNRHGLEGILKPDHFRFFDQLKPDHFRFNILNNIDLHSEAVV